MQGNEGACLKVTLNYEGGFVNDPRDPGGATDRGVTQATYDAYRKHSGLPTMNVRRMSDTECEAIYKTGYWDVVRGDVLPKGVDLCVFDFAVNSGPQRAIKSLQKSLGVSPDGWFGIETLGALNSAKPSVLVGRITADRLSFWESLRTFRFFGKGWTRRGEGVRMAALQMAARQ